MRLFIVAEDELFDLALNELRSAIGDLAIVSRLDEEVLGVYDSTVRLHSLHKSKNSCELVLPGDAILVFGNARAPEIDAASGIFVLDGVRFLQACFRTESAANGYVRGICRSGPTEESFLNYSRAEIDPSGIESDHRLVVNSFPKSGSIWLMAMIGEALSLSTDKHVHLAHGADIEIALCATGFFGGVALVRDIRDVVVSWYHEAIRADRQAGYPTSRYSDISVFYSEYFIGRIEGNPQYYFGNLERWLDFLSARAIPILRYEDMVSDPGAALSRLMNFWRLDVDRSAITNAVSRMSFDCIKNNVGNDSLYIADRLKSGHARVGGTGGWRKELPKEISKDIEGRFSGFMSRMNYFEGNSQN